MDQPQPPRRAPTPGSWRPGQSGNPRGRPRKGSALTDAIRSKVDPHELVDIALDLARNGETESTKVQALHWLRDSGYTRPAERHEIAPGAIDDDGEDLSHLSIDTLRALDELEQRYEDERRAFIARPVRALPTDAGHVPTGHCQISDENALDVASERSKPDRDLARLP